MSRYRCYSLIFARNSGSDGKLLTADCRLKTPYCSTAYTTEVINFRNIKKSVTMKKLFLFVFFILSFQSVSAQNIPNADFSDIYIGGIDRLRDWGNSEGCSMFEPFALLYHVGIDYSTPDYHIMLRTQTDTSGNGIPTFLFSSSNNSYNPGCYEDFINVGQPFPYQPDKMLGYYRFRNDSLHMNDFATCSVILKKFNTTTQQADTIGYGIKHLTPTPSDTILEPFSVDINYHVSNVVPDSVVVIFHSTGSQLPGGVLTIDDISFDFSSSTQQIDEAPVYTIFPNPVGDYLQIQSPYSYENTNIIIRNIQGQTVLQTNIKAQKPIDVRDFASGIYIIQINNINGQAVYKFIKQ